MFRYGYKLPLTPECNYSGVLQVSECNETPLVHFGLRSILVLFEKAKMGKDGVLLNSYRKTKNGK